MVTGIVIPHDETLGVFIHQFDGLASYQAVVAGYIEPIRIETPSLTLYANEEGKVRGLPFNWRATSLWWLLSPRLRGFDVLVGDVALVGTTRDGQESDVEPKLVELMTTARLFKIEVQTTSDPGWRGNRTRFADYFEAAFYAVQLATRWTQIRGVRVVQAT